MKTIRTFRIIIRFNLKTRDKKPYAYIKRCANLAIYGARFFKSKLSFMEWEYFEVGGKK